MTGNDSTRERGLVNTSELASKIFAGEEIALRFRYPNDEINVTINSLVAKILGKLDLIYLLDTILTIMREIFLNAVKANAKRIFFSRNDLNLLSTDDYNTGMRQFKEEVINDLDSYSSELSVSRFRILLKIKMIPDGIRLTVNNNITIIPAEQKRILDRINRAIASSDFTEAYESVYDTTEGAGLGITLIVLLLRNAGIDACNFSISSNDESVTTTLTVPRLLRPEATTSKIKQEIIDHVEALPTFPENIIQLQSLCENPDARIEEISERITVDPALTAEVIRLANSAGFVTGKRVKSVNEAVMIIGLKNLKAILTVAAARKILDKRYKKFEQIWSHCNRTAFYARSLALRIGLTGIIDHVFISGLLHDIGKIVLLSTNLDLVNEVSEIVSNRKIRTSTIMEEIAIGISHSSIGALMASKWNFPEYLIESIKLHHSPLNADEMFKKVVAVVYLANIFVGIEVNKYDLTYIEAEVLDVLNIKIDEKLLSIGARLKKQYDEYLGTL